MPQDYGQWNKQIENRNFLSPIGFKFALGKAPKVDFFCTNSRTYVVLF